MKRIVYYTLTIMLFILYGCVITQHVSVNVETAFKDKFPAVKDVDWDKESPTEFEAEFELNGLEMSANFDTTGTWLETESEITPNDLPETVLKTLESQYRGKNIKSIESLEKPGEPIVYEVILRRGISKFEIVLDADGNIINELDKDESDEDEKPDEWNKSFNFKNRELSTVGKNNFFNLNPGYQLILKGSEDNQIVKLIITVLDATKEIDKVNTRVVEEKETKDGELVEVSRNYFAIDKNTKDIFYFGEDVDIYENNEIIGHDSAWIAGENGNKAGLMMPGNIQIGARYYQEVAPGVAMDRAEIVSQVTELPTPAGIFESCLKTEETTPLEPGTKEYKIYAPGIGLIKDGNLLLMSFRTDYK